MGARSVQISLPEDLLERLDETPEARAKGRSAVIQSALLAYLEQWKRRQTDAAYDRAYGGKSDEVLAEFGALMPGQRWPKT